MVALRRHRVAISGGSGGNGVSTFFSNDADGLVARLQTFYDALRVQVPNDITFQVESAGGVIEDSTGTQIDVWSEPAVPSLAGTQTGGWAAGVGAVMNWLTSTVVNGKILRGKTFFVPLADVAHDADGTLSATFLTAFNTQATALRTSGAGSEAILQVWHRPTPSADGSSGPVTGHRAADRVSWLDSRRR